jgi:hypothetical protein
MSLHDKAHCAYCGHARHKHTFNSHKAGWLKCEQDGKHGKCACIKYLSTWNGDHQ